MLMFCDGKTVAHSLGASGCKSESCSVTSLVRFKSTLAIGNLTNLLSTRPVSCVAAAISRRGESPQSNACRCVLLLCFPTERYSKVLHSRIIGPSSATSDSDVISSRKEQLQAAGKLCEASLMRAPRGIPGAYDLKNIVGLDKYREPLVFKVDAARRLKNKKT